MFSASMLGAVGRYRDLFLPRRTVSYAEHLLEVLVTVRLRVGQLVFILGVEWSERARRGGGLRVRIRVRRLDF